jgi:SAM-dependent methyltransferase
MPEAGTLFAPSSQPENSDKVGGGSGGSGSVGGLFGTDSVPRASARRASDRPRSQRSPAGPKHAEPTLFDAVPDGPTTDESPQATDPAQSGGAPPQPGPPAAPSQRAPGIPFAPAAGEKAKARDVLAAVRTLKAVEREGRPATDPERQALARFAGFGPVALSLFPDPVTGRYKSAAWQALGEEFRALVTPEEYASARRATFNAFYTSQPVIDAVYAALARLGVPADATVLEPGCGTGNFLGAGPESFRFVGVELDLLSGHIARLLHPGHEVRVENFRDTRLPEASVDAAVGNVPFADLKLDYGGLRLSLHDFFLAKAADALRPGGVLALVTTHFTLDKQNAAAREYLADRADFLGAIRLPSDAFRREGTAVVADILFLRKRASGVPPDHAGLDWLGVAPLAVEGVEVAVNRYFLNRPEMVLGAWTRRDTLYGEGYGVAATGDLAEQLRAAIDRLPHFAPLPASPRPQPFTPPFAPPPPERHVTEGGFFVNDERVICRCVEGRAVPVVYGGITLRAGGTRAGKRLAALVRLRDLARRVLRSQNEGWPEPARHDARRELGGA